VRALGDLLRKAADGDGGGNTLTSYTDQVSTTVHRAVVNQLKMKYLQKGGAERGERFLPRWLEAMNLVEAWARGKGMYPHLVDNTNGTGDIWISAQQAIGLLDEETAAAALFAPVKTRASREVEQGIGFVNGFTIYPNHVMSGLKAALAGGSVDEVAELITRRAVGASRGMQRDTDSYVKSFAETEEGQKAIQRLAENLTDEQYLASVRLIDADVKPVAEAINQQYADNIVQQAGERIIKALQEGGDRGTLMAVLREVDEWATASAKPALLEADRISASVTERLNSAIVKGVLGEEGFLKAQHDWEFATAIEEIPASQLAARQEAALRASKIRAERKAYRDAKAARAAQGEAPVAASVPVPREDPVVTRDKVAQVAEREVLETEERVRAQVYTEAAERKGAPLTEQDELWLDARVADNVAMELAKRVSGRAGQKDIWGARVNAEEGSLVQAARYTANMRTWIRGTSKRMTQQLGRKVTPEEALQHINGPVFRALAASDPALWGDRAALREQLMSGRSALPDTSGRAITSEPGFDALDEFDADLALELHRFIDHVWNPNQGGFLGRSGLTAADVVKAGDFHLGKDFAQHALDPNIRLVDQALAWRGWTESSSPLDVLDRMHQSMQAAMVPQQIGHQVRAMFGHRAMRPGVPTEQLVKEGWRRIDTEHSPGVGRFMGTDTYYPPEILEQVRYVDEFLNTSRGFDPEGLPFKLAVRPWDAVTRVLKSSNTIWNPGHHVTNVLGEFGMLIMAGVNPLQSIRAVKAIRAGGGLLDADMAPLDELAATSMGRKVAEPKFSEDVVRVTVRDGRGGYRVEEVPLATVWSRAVQSGAALQHTAARDLVTEIQPGLTGNLLTNNPIAVTDEALGRFSATRDNVTRLAHYIHELEATNYGSLEDAFARAATVTHDYHPTIRTLSRWEQKYARRLIFFYTWVRQAASRVIRTGLDRPGLVTMPSKLQYNVALQEGLNPESFGGPTTDDPRIRSYTRNALLGPTGRDSTFPFSLLAVPDQDDPTMDEYDESTLAEDLWSMSLSAPQIDTLQTVFGLFNAPTASNPLDAAAESVLGGALELGTSSVNPLLGVPIEYWSERQKYGQGKGLGELFAENAGIPTRLARSIPAASPGPEGETRSVYSALFPNSAGAKRSPEEQEEEMRRYLTNWVTGMRFTNVTGGTAEEDAKRELRDRVKRKLAEQGITDSDQVSEVRDYLWELAMQERLRG
jgi:hypothetical protein